MTLTHRRSVVERGGCFQRRLFVCQFVSLFVYQRSNFRTIKRRMTKLGGQVHCTKISLQFEFRVKGQGSRSPGTKRKKCGIFSRAVLGARVVSSASSTQVGKSAHAVQLVSTLSSNCCRTPPYCVAYSSKMLNSEVSIGVVSTEADLMHDSLTDCTPFFVCLIGRRRFNLAISA